MKAIVVRPFEQPVVEEIGNGLEAMQDVVGGLIEALMPWEDEVAVICNEEGKICGLPLNRVLKTDDGIPFDVIAGTFFLCYAPLDSEDFESMPDRLIDKYISRFSF